MPKEGSIEFQGVVLELLPNAMYNNNSLPIILLTYIILVLNAKLYNSSITSVAFS